MKTYYSLLSYELVTLNNVDSSTSRSARHLCNIVYLPYCCMEIPKKRGESPCFSCVTMSRADEEPCVSNG